MSNAIRSDQKVGHSEGSSKVSLNENVLVLGGNLQRVDYGVFEQACKTLAGSNYAHVILDLTACTYVSSLVIGVLVDGVTQMNADGKDVKVRVSAEVGRFLHMAHLYHLFSYEIVDHLNNSQSDFGRR